VVSWSRAVDNDLALLEADSEAGSIEVAEQDGEAKQDEKGLNRIRRLDRTRRQNRIQNG